jgi:monovalent cation:H+ antiporter, CPA1 family
VEEFLAAETLIIELLLIVVLVASVVRQLRVPYTVALVVAGVLITFQQGPRISLTPEVILTLLVPPLVFEAAFHIGLDRLRDDLLPILALAVPGVLLTTATVGLLAAAGIGLPLPTALLFGALISATDPVAVVALFRSLSVPKRLAVLVEGESLLNDGTAIVLFNLMLVAALAASSPTGSGPTDAFDILSGSVEFLRVSLGGVGIGVVLGWLVAQLIARIDDYLIETTLTTVVAFGSYLVAERLSVSGVLAVVGAGILVGNLGPRGMSPTTRIVLFNFWEYLAFVANSLVFLLIGLDVNLPQIGTHLGAIGIGVLAVVGSRALLVYGLTWLVGRWGRPVPRPFRHVLFWGGLRGAISLALALSLPAALPDRDLLRVMAFGVVLFTLLIQGTTMRLLLSRLGLARVEPARLEYERRHGRLSVARAARDRLRQLVSEGTISAGTYELLAPDLESQIERQLEAQRELLRAEPGLEEAEHEDARREGLRAGRAILATLLSDGVISESVFEELVTEVDEALQGPAGGAAEK